MCATATSAWQQPFLLSLSVAILQTSRPFSVSPQALSRHGECLTLLPLSSIPDGLVLIICLSLCWAGRDGTMAVIEALLVKVDLICACCKPDRHASKSPTFCPLAQSFPQQSTGQAAMCFPVSRDTGEPVSPNLGRSSTIVLSCRLWSTLCPLPCFLEKLRGHSVPPISAVESVCITTRHTGYSIGISFVTPSLVLFQAS